MLRRLPAFHTIKVSCPKIRKTRYCVEDTRKSVAYQESCIELYWVSAEWLHCRYISLLNVYCAFHSHWATRQLHLETPNGCEAWSLRKRDILETRNWNLLSANHYIALTDSSVSMFVIYWDWWKRLQHRVTNIGVTNIGVMNIGIIFNVKLLLCSRTYEMTTSTK